MKDKIFTVICAVMMVFPWTLLAVRTQEWALRAPWAGILIGGYAAVMILGGIFTFYLYGKRKIQHGVMKICTVINGIYAAGGAAVICLMLV